MKNLLRSILLAVSSIMVILVLLSGKYLHQMGKSKDEKKEKEAVAGFNFWYDQRAYPYRTLNVGAYHRAFDDKKLYQSRQSPSKNSSWKSIGPNNIGGRTLCIAFNPFNSNTIYAGSASGGLWRSYSGGFGPNAWTYISTGFPVLGVGAIAIANQDSNTLYIGTGEMYNYQEAGTGFVIRTNRGSYGIGILKTTDDGNTWSQVLAWPQDSMKGVQELQIDPVSDNVIWAATTDGAYESTDAGASWQLKLNARMASDLVIDPFNHNIIIVACGYAGTSQEGIYRSADGGNSFSKILTGIPASFTGKATLGISLSNHNIVFASIADQGAGYGLFKSTNNGIAFTNINPTDFQSFQGWYSHDVAVDPANPNNVICVGSGVYKSVNGGKKLSYVGFDGMPDIHRVYYHPAGTSYIYFASDVGVWRSLDEGQSVDSCNIGYQTSQFYNTFSNSTSDSSFSMGGMQDNGSIIYKGKSKWARKITCCDGTAAQINPANDDTLYGSAEYLDIYRSDDRGKTFNELTLPVSSNTAFAAPLRLSPLHPNMIYAASDFIYKSMNAGQTWVTTNGGNPLNANPVLSLAVAPTNDNVVYAGVSPAIVPPAKIFKTTNGGVSWNDITQNLPDRYPTDIAVHPTNANIVYVSFSGFDTNHFYKSADGGTSWVASDNGLPNVPTNSILIDPIYPDTLYVGNDLGVYISSNGGNSWQNWSDGLPGAVIAMSVSISSSNRKIRVATHGNGVYERSMPGNKFRREETLPVTSYDVIPNPFSSSFICHYSLDHVMDVSIKIFSSEGKVIAADHEGMKGAGNYSYTFQPKEKPDAGIFFLELKKDNEQKIIKLVCVR